jgi:hypothetical protein
MRSHASRVNSTKPFFLSSFAPGETAKLSVDIARRLSRVAGVPCNFDARPFGENILPVARFTFEIRIGYRRQGADCEGPIPIAVPRATPLRKLRATARNISRSLVYYVR